MLGYPVPIGPVDAAGAIRDRCPDDGGVFREGWRGGAFFRGCRGVGGGGGRPGGELVGGGDGRGAGGGRPARARGPRGGGAAGAPAGRVGGPPPPPPARGGGGGVGLLKRGQ